MDETEKATRFTKVNHYRKIGGIYGDENKLKLITFYLTKLRQVSDRISCENIYFCEVGNVDLSI